MFASSDRESPCSARTCFSSFSRATSTRPSSSVNEMPFGKSRTNSPFGPFTRTFDPSMLISTPFDTGIGSFPIRDIALPHVAQDFAADASAPRVLSGHDPLRRRKNGDAQPAVYARDLALLDVHPQPRLADSLDAAQHRIFLPGVVQPHAHELPATVFRDFVAADEALVTQHIGDRKLHLRRGNVHVLMLRRHGVAYPRQHVRDWVRHVQGLRLLVLPCSPIAGAFGKDRDPRSALPARFLHSRQLSAQRHLTEADPAQREITDVRPRPPAQLAAVLRAHAV